MSIAHPSVNAKKFFEYFTSMGNEQMIIIIIRPSKTLEALKPKFFSYFRSLSKLIFPSG
jgi:hypothetical protein